MSTSLQCPLCQQADSALHILSGCQRTIISGMIAESHNVACRLIMNAISKGSIYTSHTLNHLKELGLDAHKAHKTALKLYAHPVLYAHKLTTTSS